MADRFSVTASPTPDAAADRLETAARSLGDLTEFWPALAKSVADRAQARWPLRRRTATLRASLTWHGSGLGRLGIYEPSRDALRIGTAVFYAGFHHHGAKNLRKRSLLSIDAADVTDRLGAWTRGRLVAAGLGVAK